MSSIKKLFTTVKVAGSLLGLGAAACLPEVPLPDGECTIVGPEVLDCRAEGYDGELQPAGLIGYSCTGSVRPDEDAIYNEGVPQGVVCSDRGPVGGGDARGYCCTEERTHCAYDPVSSCEEGTVGYKCWPTKRPESVNPTLSCSNGIPEETRGRRLVNYCCAAEREPHPCNESNAAGCPPGLTGWLCESDRLPRGEYLGPNRSRADYFQPMCSVPKPQPNPAYVGYCCYMPALVPVGGTCVPHHGEVSGCAPGRFGVACYGPDHPEENFLALSCPEPGVRGLSGEGYPATVYCCDFHLQ